MTPDDKDEPARPHDIGRRRFVGYLLGGAGFVAVADLGVGAARAVAAPVPSLPQVSEVFDLMSFLAESTRSSSRFYAVGIDEKGHAHLALPRAEVGQGITTSSAMIVADELGFPPERVHVTLAPAVAEMGSAQFTGGSSTTVATWTPLRVAAATARTALLQAAAVELGVSVGDLRLADDRILAPSGRSMSVGEAAALGRPTSTRAVEVELRPLGSGAVVGTPRRRLDARDAVTGAKTFTMDLDVPGALPTMVCRAPDLNGTPSAVRNRATVLAMPGVTHVAVIPTGVAVRARTFGQCIDAIRRLDVAWRAGSVSGRSDTDVLSAVRRTERSLGPKVPGTTTIDGDAVFHFRSGSALEPNCAIADVRSDRAEVWSALKSPTAAQSAVAKILGLSVEVVTVNVVTGGGSFGRRLFFDAALEAVHASKAFGAPVRLMWHRADEPRQGRVHPMATSRIRATLAGDRIISFEQRHTSVTTDFTLGLGQQLASQREALPEQLANAAASQGSFLLTQELGYDVGLVTQTFDETSRDAVRLNTGSVRNVFSPDVRVASELMMDRLAARLGQDPLAFRREHLKDDAVRRVLDRVAVLGRWGRPMPAGTAQGLAIHVEFRGATAVLVEIDCRPATVRRTVRDGVTGPRVTRATVVVDCGLVVNPLGVEAQMLGGFVDGMAQVLTYSSHLRDGHFLEASWDNSAYPRQWNVPFRFDCEVLDSDATEPGGVGEAAVASSAAAVACAYARATGTVPTRFPINHDDPLFFEPKPFVPPVPASPTNGVELAQ